MGRIKYLSGGNYTTDVAGFVYLYFNTALPQRVSLNILRESLENIKSLVVSGYR